MCNVFRFKFSGTSLPPRPQQSQYYYNTYSYSNRHKFQELPRVPSCGYKRLCKIIIIQTHRRLDNKLITIFSDVLAYLYSIIIYCISRYFYNVHTRIIYGESTVRAEFFVQSGGNEVCTSIGSFVFFSVFLLPPVLQLFVTGENHTIFYWIYYIIHYIIIHAFYTTRCYTHSL